MFSPILGSIVVSISACHAEDRGSIPRQGVYGFFSLFLKSSDYPALLLEKKTMISIFKLNYLRSEVEIMLDCTRSASKLRKMSYLYLQ